MNIAIISGNGQYRELFKSLGFSLEADHKHADMILFTGGEDVSPNLYGDYQHAYTGNNPRRDNEEGQIFADAVIRGVPVIGICRGSQFLNVMSGGRLYQHCEGHTRSHNIEDLETGHSIYVSSTHHQIAIPGDKAEMVAVSVPSVKCEWYDGHIARREDVDNTAEVIWYPHTKALCVQFHPEFESLDSAMGYYFESLIHRFIIPEVKKVNAKS